MRLIDADALMVDCQLAQKQADRHGREFANAFYSGGGEISTEWWCVEDMIENAPTIEPERKTGRWYDIGSLSCRCSACGCKSQKESKFCPNCGADMRERDVDAIKELPIEERKEDKYKIGYADGYHKAESDYYARTATDRDNAFKMGIEVGRGERKTGQWVVKKNVFGVAYCSECDYELHTNDTNYCPNCGTRMIGSEENG